MTLECRNSTTNSAVAVNVEAGGTAALTDRGFVAKIGDAEIRYSSSYGDVTCIKRPTDPTFPAEEIVVNNPEEHTP